MTEADANSAARRVIAFLEQCDNIDISAGVGAILGLGTEEKIAAFRQGIADAIVGKRTA